MARNFGESGRSSEPGWEGASARIGSCRRCKMNSPKPIMTRRPSRLPRCPARFHDVHVDRFALAVTCPSGVRLQPGMSRQGDDDVPPIVTSLSAAVSLGDLLPGIL